MSNLTITLFQYIHPIENVGADITVMILFILFGILYVSTTAYYVKMKIDMDHFIYMLKAPYAILLTISEVFTMTSIYITYGFMAQSFTDDILQSECSVWTYWIMFLLGLGLWISILVNTIGNTAMILLGGSLKSAMRKMVRTSLMFICLVIYIITGILGEIFNMFRVGDACITHASFKIINIFIILIFLATIVSIGLYLKKNKDIATEDKKGLLIEMKIVYCTLFLFVVLVFLNIFSLTAYWPGRLILALIVIVIFTYTHIIYIIGPICHYHNSRLLSFLPDVFTVAHYSQLGSRPILNDGTDTSRERFDIIDPENMDLTDDKYGIDSYLSNPAYTHAFFKSISDLSKTESSEQISNDERVYLVKIHENGTEYKFTAHEIIDFANRLYDSLERLRQEDHPNEGKTQAMHMIDRLFNFTDYSMAGHPMLKLQEISIISSFIAAKMDTSQLMNSKMFYEESCNEIYNFLKDNIITSLFSIWSMTGHSASSLREQHAILQQNMTLYEDSNDNL